ncbi:hypothetical protein QJQ45_004744 [Haematococcus lacustris]|nr:hypothetical protein QJQ45_004744 [Haematococcus lacustris]
MAAPTAEGFTTVGRKGPMSYSAAARARTASTAPQQRNAAQRSARRPAEVLPAIVLQQPSDTLKALAASVMTRKATLVLRAHHSPSDMAVLREQDFSADQCAKSALEAANLLLPSALQPLQQARCPPPFIHRAADGAPIRGSVQVTLEGPADSIAAVKQALLQDIGHLECWMPEVSAKYPLQLCRDSGKDMLEYHLTSIKSDQCMARTAPAMMLQLLQQYEPQLHGLQVVWVGRYDAITQCIGGRVDSSGMALPTVTADLPTGCAGLVALTCGGRQAFSLPGRVTVPIKAPELDLTMQLQRARNRLTLAQAAAQAIEQAGAQALQWVAEWATTGFQELAAIPSLTNLSSLLHLCRVTQPAGRGDRVGSREWQRAVWGEEQVARSIAVAVRANPARCATGLFAMWARLPTGWQQEVARQAPLPAPADPQALQRVAVAMVMDRLGWLPKAPPTGRAPAPSPIPILEGATVKCFTRVLMEPVTMLRAEANARFVKDALAGIVCRYVVGDFWSQVQDFVALHTIPHNWPAGNSIPHNHPFICTHGDGQARQLRTHLPDIGAIEDMLPVDLD